MKLIPTFCDGKFYGFESMKTIAQLKKEALELARVKQEAEKADHMIFGFYDLDENGNVAVARLYSGLAKTDEEFEAVAARLSNAHIYAIHASSPL